MKKNTLEALKTALQEEKNEIELDKDTLIAAKRALELLLEACE